MLTFRKAAKADIGLLIDMAHEIWLSYYPSMISIDQIKYMLQLMYSQEAIEKELKDGVVWEIIENENIFVGFLSYAIGKEEVKLNKLYLKTAHHGKGYGKVALYHVIDYARLHQYKRVYLTVNKNNVKAITAYEKTGFVRTDSAVIDIGGGFVMDDYIYSYWL